jgi:phenylalanyl-tRNA synthetase beta subunit
MIKKVNLRVSDYQKSERDFAFIVNKELSLSRFDRC